MDKIEKAQKELEMQIEVGIFEYPVVQKVPLKLIYRKDLDPDPARIKYCGSETLPLNLRVGSYAAGILLSMYRTVYRVPYSVTNEMQKLLSHGYRYWYMPMVSDFIHFSVWWIRTRTFFL